MTDAIIIIFVTIIAFALLREVICWYHKINIRLEVSEKILAEQKETNRLLALMVKDEEL
jgi:hypothetical protein